MSEPRSGWQPLAPNIWVRQYPPFRMNVGLIVGDEGCLVIDTRATEDEGLELRGDVSAVTTVPVRTVVNTHAHFDHCFGNGAFSDTAIWGHEDCRRVLESFGASERDYWAKRVEGIDLDALRSTRIVPPNKSLSDRHSLSVRPFEVEFSFLGRGHTEHDIVVELKETGVLFAGDLIEAGSPPWFDDSWPLEWPGTVQRLLDMGSETYVPGHGEPMTRHQVARQLKDLSTVADLAAAVLAGELKEDEAVKTSPFPAEPTRAAMQRARETATGSDQRGWSRAPDVLGPPNS